MSAIWQAILNPVSGSGQAVRHRASIEGAFRQAGVDYRLAVSEHAGHSIDLARDAAMQGCRRFIAIGGDGTLNEIVNGLARTNGAIPSDATLALIPVGRGNDWARTHRIPSDYAQAAAVIRDEHRVAHDVGVALVGQGEQACARYFINVAGAGFDAHVLECARASRLGPLAYLAGLLRGFVSYRSTQLVLSSQEASASGRMFVAFAAIGRYCGGGMQVAPAASTQDGLLDITMIGELTKLDLIFNLKRLFDGSLPQYHKVRTWRTDALRVQALQPIQVQADGELLGEAPVNFSVLPHALHVIVPAPG